MKTNERDPVILTFVVVAAFESSTIHKGGYSAPTSGPLGTLFYSLIMMTVALPSVVITYRCVPIDSRTVLPV